MPETKYYINKLLHNIDKEFVIKPKVEFAFGKRGTKVDMINMFKKQMNVTMDIKKEQVSQFKRCGTLEMSLFKEFSTKKQPAKEVAKKRVIYHEDGDSDDLKDV